MDKALGREILEYQDFLGFKIKRERIRLEDNKPHDESIALDVCHRFYGKEGELDEAIVRGNRILKRLILMDEERDKAYLSLFYALVGNMYYLKGNFNYATGYFMKVLDYERKDLTAWVELLFSLRARGEFELFEEGIFNIEEIYKEWKKGNTEEMCQEILKKIITNRYIYSKERKIIHRLGIVQLTKYCNQKCLFCSTPPFNEQPSFNELIGRIRKLKEEGTTELMLSGGEPTIRTDLGEIVSFAKSLNFDSISMQTNGTLLNNQEKIERLFFLGLSKIHVSFHSHIKEVYDKITHTNKDYEKVIGSLKILNTYPDRLGINITINSLNYRQLPELINFLLENFQNIHSFSINYCDVIGKAEENKWIVPRLSDVKPYLYKSMNLLNKADKHFMVDFVPLCYLMGYEEHSSEYLSGDDYQNKNIYFFGDNKHFDGFQQGESYPKIKDEKCKMCKYKQICGGLNKRYVEIYGSDEVIPIDK